MPVCPVCQAEIDDAARAAGKCAGCGVVLRKLPQRTIADFRLLPEADDDDDNPSHATTIDLTPIDASKLAGAETQSTIDFGLSPPGDTPPGDEESSQPATITFGDEPTIEWPGGASDPDATLLASQWERELKNNDPQATIKQQDTISGSYVTSSSLIVKSRHVRQSGVASSPIMSPSDAPDYELLNIIGEGGMGVVYAARQSSIARTVALKMLKSEEGRQAAHRDKFISEAVVTGELDHPNIVPIYDLGANDEGALFYSMKRVKGTPWNKVIRQKSVDENLQILLRVADAVAFAHVNGVIHRDLKPENVMLGDFGEVLVMDWGLARVSAEFPNAASVTQSDAMGGTPAYMAPEMATGPLEKITAASDVYLLGAILYEIIIGKPPHSGKTVMSCLFSAAKNDITVPDKSHELVDISLKAMATNPEDRHQTVPEFQQAVREYQAHSESIKLVGHATKNMTKAAEAQDYELYARSLYGLEESLALWPGNRRAASLLSTARLDYAGLALAKGDYDLGASLLDPAVDEHKEVLGKLESGRRERESRQRRIKLLKGAVFALVASVIGIISVASIALKKQKDEAVAQRDRAVTAEGQALANAEEAKANAVEARKNADEAKANALTAEANERTAKNNAEEARLNAEEARREETRANNEAIAAKKARDEAQVAEKKEQYEAYIARIGLTKAKLDENAFDRAVQLLDACPEELRRWEWGRLAFLCHLDEATWPAGARVEAAAMSPDGEHFALGDLAGKASIWNLKTGEREQEMPQGTNVLAVAYDGTGQRLASGSNDGMVHIYRASDHQELAKFKAHKDGVSSVRFSPDGKRLLTGGFDKMARLWDAETGKPLDELQGHSWWVWAAEFSPDAKRIVTAGQDGKAIVWEQGPSRARPKALYHEGTSFMRHRGPIFAAKFSPDGKQVATAGYDGRILLWRPEAVNPIDLKARIDDLPDPPAPYRELVGHRGPVQTLAFSPDGKTLASGGQDNQAMVWDVAQGSLLKTLRGHASYVRGCAFSPDGELLLTAGRDAQIKLWRPATYADARELAAPPEQREAVLTARFSTDGKQIVTAGRDRTATLWNAESLEPVRHFDEGHAFLASSAVFFADGSRLATGAGDGTVRLWDAATGGELFHIDGAGRTAALDVSDNGELIATGSAGNHAQLWDATNGEKVADLAGVDDVTVTAVSFAPGNKMIATGDDLGRCRLWRYDPASKQWKAGAWLRGHSRTITALAFADGGARLISASGDNTVGQWDVAGARELTDRVLRHPDWVGDVAVSRDGRIALTCCDDGRVRLWSLEDGRVQRTFEPRNKALAVSSIDMTADGRLAAAACAADGAVRLWDLSTGVERTVKNDKGVAEAWLDRDRRSGLVWAARFTPEGDRLLVIGGNDAQLMDVATRKVTARFSPHGVIAAAEMSPDGTRVVTGSWDGSAKIWDTATGNVVVKLEGQHEGYINSARFSPDGSRVLTAGDDQTARLWDAATGEPLDVVLEGHVAGVCDALYSPDGARILTTSRDKTAKLWDAATGKELATLPGHEFDVRSGAFSGEGDSLLIITGSDDNKAIIWDAKGNPLRTLVGHTGGITSVALSPDGTRALTGSQDNAVKLWDATTGKEILTLSGHGEEVTSVSFSPDGLAALTSGRDGRTLVWPAVDWTAPAARTAGLRSAR
jgi:WD40 repeat protein/serine/threonine protein kinase